MLATYNGNRPAFCGSSEKAALETAPSGQLAQNLTGPLRPFTPKEFSFLLGDLRTAEWVREQCATGAIKTVSGPDVRPFLILASELGRFRPPVDFAVCA